MQEHQDEPHHAAVGNNGADARCVMENVWMVGWSVTATVNGGLECHTQGVECAGLTLLHDVKTTRELLWGCQ